MPGPPQRNILTDIILGGLVASRLVRSLTATRERVSGPLFARFSEASEVRDVDRPVLAGGLAQVAIRT